MQEESSTSRPGRTPRANFCSAWAVVGLSGVLVALVAAVFGQTLGFGFVNFDDDVFVYQHPVVSRGWSWAGVRWVFTHGHSTNWNPLTTLSHMLDCELFGLRPGAHHAMNVALHAIAVVGLFLVLRELTDRSGRSFWVAAIFAIHPLRAESVAWISERKDVLSGVFFVLILWAYTRYVRQGGRGRYAVVIAALALGLLSKPMLVTMPGVLLLLDFWPLRRVATREEFWRRVREKLPLAAIALVMAGATLIAQRGTMERLEVMPLGARVVNALTAVVVYLRDFFWPVGLAPFHPFMRDGNAVLRAGLAGASIAGVTAWAWWRRREQPFWLVGWGWYLVMLLPVCGLVQVGPQAHADRYTYLPQIGWTLALVWGTAEVVARSRRAQLVALVGGAAAVVALGVIAHAQVGIWRDSVTLWVAAVERTPVNALAQNNLATALQASGRVREAAAIYERILQREPKHANARQNYGTALLQLGRANEAVEQLRAAADLNPHDAHTLNNLGVALMQVGRANEAIPWLQRAAAEDAMYASPHLNLGRAWYAAGRREEAARALQQAIALKPTPEAHLLLGEIRRERGEWDEASAALRAALQLDASLVTAQVRLAEILERRGEEAEAREHWDAALRLQPENAVLRNNLAWLLATSRDAHVRDGARARDLAREAVEKSGGRDPRMLSTLAAALAECGEFAEAARTATVALGLAQEKKQNDLTAALQEEIIHYQRREPVRATR